MSSFSHEGFIPELPDQVELDLVHQSDVGLAQALFQENHLLREQIAHHTQLMQLLTHQLATPLTTLSGSVHLLAEGELSVEQRHEFLGVIEQQIYRLQTLLKDLVALRDLETGKLETHPTSFCIKALVEEAIADFAPYPVLYQFETNLPEVWGDRWQVSQVLVNLISNAIKYSPSGNAITIGASVKQLGWVEVWVKDQGLGIPEADKSHVFERFYRVRHYDRQDISGTGLGLSLCQLLVQNQGGQLGFESLHGQGSRFYFTLPSAEMGDR